MTTLRPVLGSIAKGDSFWDREEERRDLIERLQAGRSIVLSGARRVGKSSVVNALLEELGEDWVRVTVDVQECASAAEMFAMIGAAASQDGPVRGRMRDRWSDLRERIEEVDLLGIKIGLQDRMQHAWRDDARALLEDFVDPDRPTVIAIDEFALLLDRLSETPGEIGLVVGVINAAIARHPSIRWVVYGSIGLEPLLDRAGVAGQMTDFANCRIGPWSNETTTGAVTAMAAFLDLPMEPNAAAAVGPILGSGVPWHVQLLVEELRQDHRSRPDSIISAADVKRVYDERLLQSSARMHMVHQESRLRRVLGEGPELRIAFDLLTETAVVGTLTWPAPNVLAEDSMPDEDVTPTLRRILAILQHDAYLVERSDVWRLESNLLRDWWRHGYERGYRTAAERRADDAGQATAT